MADGAEHTRRNGDGRFPWQIAAVILSMLIALSAFGKTWFVNDYRLEQVEKRVSDMGEKIDRMDNKITRVETTYQLLIDQARQHGWVIPWVPRRGGNGP